MEIIIWIKPNKSNVMKTYYSRLKAVFILLPLSFFFSCKKDMSEPTHGFIDEKGTLTRSVRNESVGIFQTSADQSELLQQQPNVNFVLYGAPNSTTVTVDETTTYQGIDGFGFMLTGGAATLLNGLGSNQTAVLNELFGTGTGQIGISYLRISIGHLI
jgi:glucosylceramidase